MSFFNLCWKDLNNFAYSHWYDYKKFICKYAYTDLIIKLMDMVSDQSNPTFVVVFFCNNVSEFSSNVKYVTKFELTYFWKYTSKFYLIATSVSRCIAAKIFSIQFESLNLSFISYTCLHTSNERLSKRIVNDKSL